MEGGEELERRGGYWTKREAFERRGSSPGMEKKKKRILDELADEARHDLGEIEAKGK
jgi:hypothetical protein